jgi:CDP-diacylglycerol--serine O-phosphatidyltransferase
MVTNAPFYSFKVVGGKRTVPFVVIVAIALGIAVISLDPPRACSRSSAYGLSGYVVYAWRKRKGKPVQRDRDSTDEPDEKGLHHDGGGRLPSSMLY